MDAKIFVNLCKSCEEGHNVEIVKTKKNNLRNDLGGLGVRKHFSAEKYGNPKASIKQNRRGHDMFFKKYF